MPIEDTMERQHNSSASQGRVRVFYRLSKNFGQEISGIQEVKDRFVSDMLGFFSYAPFGSTIVIDFEGVNLFSVASIGDVISELSADMKGDKKEIFKNKYLIAKDPNGEIKWVLGKYAKEYGCSIIVYYQDGDRYEILNLPRFLKGTLDLIIQRESLTSRELSELLGERGKNSREYLHQLNRRGLVARTAVDSGYDRVVWRYTAVRL